MCNSSDPHEQVGRVYPEEFRVFMVWGFFNQNQIHKIWFVLAKFQFISLAWCFLLASPASSVVYSQEESPAMGTLGEFKLNKSGPWRLHFVTFFFDIPKIFDRDLKVCGPKFRLLLEQQKMKQTILKYKWICTWTQSWIYPAEMSW